VSERAGIRRILVALDASRQSVAALNAAAFLAEALEAELLGMFVEDVNLVRWSALPFAREIGHATARARPLAEADLALALRAQAVRAQQALARIATGRGVTWSFRVARGEVAATLLAAAHDSDLVALGASFISWTAGRQLGSTARAVMGAAPRPVLLLPNGTQWGPPYVVVYDGSGAAQRALAIALHLTGAEKSARLVVVLMGEARSESARRGIAKQLTRPGVSVEIRNVATTDVAELVRVVRATSPGSVIVPIGVPLLANSAAADRLAALRCAVLIVP
jgi:nucleotide-binding universal stress UspA family protein